MKKLWLLVGVLSVVSAVAGEYPSPDKWEKTVQEFEAQDRAHPPPPGAILGIGSSSMRMWHPTLDQDLAPLTILHRGFGGSNMNDVLAYVDRIVLPYHPRAILLYEGDNDIKQGVSPEKFRDTFVAFQQAVHRKLPETRIYVIAIKPSISRWNIWPEMNRANALVEQVCKGDERLTFLDVVQPMLGADGKPLPDIFKADNLHMNEKGYAIWTRTIGPVLKAAELKFEQTQ